MNSGVRRVQLVVAPDGDRPGRGEREEKCRVRATSRRRAVRFIRQPDSRRVTSRSRVALFPPFFLSPRSAQLPSSDDYGYLATLAILRTEEMYVRVNAKSSRVDVYNLLLDFYI